MIEHIPAHHLPQPDPGPYERGRVCSHARCITRLHKNNPGPRCELHTLMAMPQAELVAEVLASMDITSYP
jgi:hypothetical protein